MTDDPPVPHPAARPDRNVLDVLEMLHDGRRYTERCPLCSALPCDPCCMTPFERALTLAAAAHWSRSVAHLFDPPLDVT